MTPQPNTRIDGPYKSGTLSINRKLTHFYDGGWEYQAGTNPLTCVPVKIPPSRLVEDVWKVTPDAPNPSETPKSSPPPLDPPEPSSIYLANNFDSLTDIYRLGREHGRQEVAWRLPRLWGWWWNTGRWFDGTGCDGKETPYLVTTQSAKEECPAVFGSRANLSFREYDPITGGPRGG